MKRREKNKLSMYRVVERVLEDNTIIWNSTPGFVIAKNSLSALISKIDSDWRRQDEITTGITIDKREMKIELSATAAVMSGVVTAYAIDTSNAELQEAVNFTQRKLFKFRDNRMLSHCNNIYKNALANAPALVSYGITPAKLNALQTLINNFSNKAPSPRAAQAYKQSLTKNIRTTFRETDNLLKLKIDNMMLLFKATHPAFYVACKAAREIHDIGQVHTRLTIMVRDAQGDPIEGADVSLLQNNETVYTKTTNADGRIHITRIKPGIYNIMVKKAAYKNWSQPEVTFISGKRVSRIAVLSGGM